VRAAEAELRSAVDALKAEEKAREDKLAALGSFLFLLLFIFYIKILLLFFILYIFYVC
jgi:hypothetical protein